MKEYIEWSFVGDLFFSILINSLASTCSLNLQTTESSESSKITVEHESNISSYCGAAFHSRPCPVHPGSAHQLLCWVTLTPSTHWASRQTRANGRKCKGQAYEQGVYEQKLKGLGLPKQKKIARE